MGKVATDIYTFSELRRNGFTYVDKTDILYEMASGNVGKQFFIARPRRFGKSLAVSTLKALCALRGASRTANKPESIEGRAPCS